MSAESPRDESATAEANAISPPKKSHLDDAAFDVAVTKVEAQDASETPDAKQAQDASSETPISKALVSETAAVKAEAEAEAAAVKGEAEEEPLTEEEAAAKAAKKAAKKARKAAKKEAKAKEEAEKAAANDANGNAVAESGSDGQNAEEPSGPRFSDFELDKRILKNLEGMGFEHPTPIQAASLTPLLEGIDIIGRARTGSGKTAAYGLPLVQQVAEGTRSPRSIVLCPTRELAQQTALVLQKFAKGMKNVEIVTLFGGVPFVPQLRQLERGAAVVVGTPGRLLDHLRRGNLRMEEIQTIVLDEADEMLRMGFIDDVTELLDATPDERQVALFSATMPPVIERIAKKHLRNPTTIQVESKGLSVDHIEQRYCFVPPARKLEALSRFMLAENWGTTLLFCRTRRGCGEVAHALAERGVSAAAIHSDLDMAARTRALQDLDKGRIQVLVATDVAARGIDVQGIGRVVNFDFPDEIESYVHRIGRTGRAGREGHAMTFVTPGERYRLGKLRNVLKVDPEQATVPSDAQLQELHLQGIIKDIGNFIGKKSVLALQELTERLLGESFPEVSQADLLATTLALLCKEKDIYIEGNPDTSPPFWAKREDRSRERGGRAAQAGRSSNSGETEVVLSAGRNSGLRPADIVGSLLAQTSVPKESIGRITMQNHQCFVWIAEDVAASLVDSKGINVRGEDIGISWSKQGGGGTPRQGRRSFDRGSDRGPRENRGSPRAPRDRGGDSGEHRRDREPSYDRNPKPTAVEKGPKKPSGKVAASKKQADSIKVRFEKASQEKREYSDAQKPASKTARREKPAEGAASFKKKPPKAKPAGKKATGKKKKKAADSAQGKSGKKFAATRVDNKKPKKKAHRGQG